jgi:hypothetical protein
MKKDIFDDQFMKCGYNYEKMIGKLRLNKKREITFKYITDSEDNLNQYIR